MRVKPLHDTLGIEILDFDVTQTCSAETRAELRDLFCKHHLLLLRSDKLTDERQNRFVEHFGPLSLMLDGTEAGYVTNQGEGVPTGRTELLWHADGTYGSTPGIATSLWAKEIKPGAGPTAFLNAAHALATLPRELRTKIENLSTFHLRDTQREPTKRGFRAGDMDPDADPSRYRSYVHPIIYRLPHCDKDVLFVNELMTSHVVGMTAAESEALLLALFDHLYAPENAYEHHWQTGDMIIWDNIALQHCRPDGFGSAPRHLRRLTIDGWSTDHGVLDWVAPGGLRDPLVAAA